MFDSHVHYDHKKFDNGREELLQKMHEDGLEYCLNAAIDFESNEKMMRFLGKYPWIYFAVGIHPNAVEMDREKDAQYAIQIREWTKSARVKAIGETGLDYYRLEQLAQSNPEVDLEKIKERQKEWFRISMEIAKENNLPLILHVRGSDESAVNQEVLQILDEYGYEGMTGVIHCFSGNLEMAKEYVKRGFLIGIGGMITRDGMEGLREVVREVPIEKILLETDSPFVRPVGMEGKRNTSESLSVIAGEIAKIKEMSVEEVEKKTTENAKELFGLSFGL